MPQQVKYFNVDPHVLVQWTFSDSHVVSENYQILTNLNTQGTSFLSTTINNTIDHTLMVLDSGTHKYVVTDPAKYNYLQVQNFFSPPVQYDQVRIYFPLNFNFIDQEVMGFYFRVYAYNYYNKVLCDFTDYFFDISDVARQNEIQLNPPFIYNEQQWGKYIELDIPSLYYISRQRQVDNSGNNLPIPNSINASLSKGVGMSDTSPIFVDFSFITSTQTIFGVKNYFLNNPTRVSTPQFPEYQDVACAIVESTVGDFFEIYGTYAGDNALMDDFVQNLIIQGRNINIEYAVSVYEENIFQSTQTFLVTSNFSQKINFRPIITFSNTTAYISVVMTIIDLVDGSKINRVASIGLIDNLLKYGLKLTRINIADAYTPVIYNQKASTVLVGAGSAIGQVTNININTVNYPLITDRYKILVSSSNAATSDYVANGLLNIILTPFTNVIGFNIAKAIDSQGNAQPLDLSTLLVNSKLTLSFKSDSNLIEKEIFYESDKNNYSLGVVIYNLDETDLTTVQKIYADNNNFYLTIRANNLNTRTMLYSGKFFMYKDVSFIQPIPTQNLNSLASNAVTGNTAGSSVSIQTISGNTMVNQNINYFCVLLFLLPGADYLAFETSLYTLIKKNQIFTKYNNCYFITSLTPPVLDKIKKLPQVDLKSFERFTTSQLSLTDPKS